MGVYFSEDLVEIVHVASADDVRKKIETWFDDIDSAHTDDLISEAFEAGALWFEAEGIQNLPGLVISIELNDLDKNLSDIAGLYAPLFPEPS
jgi:hypothetical protein